LVSIEFIIPAASHGFNTSFLSPYTPKLGSTPKTWNMHGRKTLKNVDFGTMKAYNYRL